MLITSAVPFSYKRPCGDNKGRGGSGRRIAGHTGARYSLEKGGATREVHFGSKKQMDKL